MSIWVTPMASQTALITAGGAPMAPASPQPRTPSALVGLTVTLVDTSKLGRPAALGMQ